MNLYTADLHLGHANSIRFDNRPFSDVNEMDKMLIYNWNYVTNKDDDIYINGDFIYRGEKEASWYLRQLKGRKHLIIGNHDGAILKDDRALSYFESVEKMMHVIDGRNHICMCHFPIAEWNGFYKGHYHIYAHIHNNTNDVYHFMKKYDRALNAGCMINNYKPVTLNELIQNNKIFKEQH